MISLEIGEVADLRSGTRANPGQSASRSSESQPPGITQEA